MKGKLFALILSVAALAFAGALHEAKAAGVTLDPTFGSGGELMVRNAADLNDSANALVVQPDGKILVGGDIGDSPHSHAVLLRLNPNGSLDQMFGTGGRVVSSTQLDVGGIALQADGKILVAGGIAGERPISFALARYNADGSLDQTFGTGGFATLGPQTFVVIQSDSNALVVQPDGKIVVAGFVTIYPNGDKFAIARFNPNGSLDQSFGTNGSFITTTSMNDRALAVALQADGKIVASGYATTAQAQRDFALARYNANGTPDLNFGIEGKLTTNFSFRNFAHAYGVAIQPDGKIVAVGGFTRASDGFLLTRYDDQGRLDQGFGTGGRVTNTFGSGSGAAHAVRLQPDGKIIVAGSVSYNGTGNEAVVLARYNRNGSFDQNFGTNGFLITDFDSGTLDTANALALQPDGKLVLAGYASEPSGSYTDFALARYSISSPRAALYDFDGDRTSDLSVFRPNGGVWYLMQSMAGFRAQAWGANGDMLVPADYDGDGKTDVAVFRVGNWYILNSSDNTMRAEVFGQINDVPVAGDYDGDGKADPAVFRQGNWYVLQSAAGFRAQAWGFASDKAVPADYDGDGKTDFAVFRSGAWYELQSSNGQLRTQAFGQNGDVLVAGDYDGDGRSDAAVFRQGSWYVLYSSDGSFNARQFGIETDRVVPADYDGDGRYDIAVFRGGTWYILRSSNGSLRAEAFGTSDDVPVSSAVY
ncbi:MAG TPA: FG-GAP-like repeat-containing protein [Pyrinomonadaceae bacterium]|jgi:uncharacterized delta-60 repeat protein